MTEASIASSSNTREHELQDFLDSARVVLDKLKDRREKRLAAQLQSEKWQSLVREWYEKPETTIILAIWLEILWPMRLQFELYCFLIIRPLRSRNFIAGFYRTWFRDGQLTSDEIGQWQDAFLTFGEFIASLHLAHIFKPLILKFVSRNHLIVMCAFLALPLGAGFLPAWQKIWLKRLRLKLMKLFYHKANKISEFFGLWASNMLIRGARLWLTFSMAVAKSFLVRTIKFCIERAIIWILKRQNFDQLPVFRHAKLNHDYRRTPIRILVIDRKVPFCNLKAELVDCSLDDLQRYEAVSYVWGKDPAASHGIILNNHQFFVSAHVSDILWRRSSYFRKTTMWIDSICIDQSNTNEKSLQVLLMGIIYQRASQVFVCLGESPDAWLAMSLLQELIFVKSSVGTASLAKYIWSFFSRIDKDELLKARLAAFLNLMHHPWFGRAWVVQEVAVAESVTILYGNQSISWNWFAAMAEILFKPATTEAISLFQYASEKLCHRPLSYLPSQAVFIDDCKIGYQNGVHYPLCAALRELVAFEATEPRDKLFALLAYTNSDFDIVGFTDYDRPVSELLYEVAEYFRKKGQVLQVLHLAGIGWGPNEMDLPSWVVNWTTCKERNSLAHSFRKEELSYWASGPNSDHISYGISNRHIIARGQFVDRIRKTGSAMEVSDGKNLFSFARSLEKIDSIIAWIEHAEGLAHEYSVDPYHNKQPLSEAFWRTLIGDVTVTSRPAKRRDGDNVSIHLKLLHQLRSQAGRGRISVEDLYDLRKEKNLLGAQFPTSNSLRDFLSDSFGASFICGQPAFPRSFCVTDEGYIAMVPHLSKPGDIICIIYGGQVPFVLRRVDGDRSRVRYWLVGECYVHGIMDGEALNLGHTAEDFEII